MIIFLIGVLFFLVVLLTYFMNEQSADMENIMENLEKLEKKIEETSKHKKEEDTWEKE